MYMMYILYAGAPNGSFQQNICLEGLNRLRYSDLIAVKTRDFFGKNHLRLS